MDERLVRLLRDIEGESDELETEVRIVLRALAAELERENPSRARLLVLQERLTALSIAAESLVEGLGTATREWVSGGLREQYEAAVDKVPGSAGMDPTHTAILGARSSIILGAILPLVGRVATASRQWSRNMAFTLQRARALPSAAEIERLVGTHPIGRVRYSDGSWHRVGEYAAMVLDTNSALAVNEATIAESRRQGISVLQISDGPNCGLGSHKGSPKADGLLVTLETAQTFALAHPRCHRSFTPRPDLDSV